MTEIKTLLLTDSRNFVFEDTVCSSPLKRPIRADPSLSPVGGAGSAGVGLGVASCNRFRTDIPCAYGALWF